MEIKKKVLFICIHNSGRSQMAEAFFKELAGDKFEVESAGLEPGKLNQLVVEVMMEAGIDISKNETNSVFQFFKEGRLYDYSITVCDESGEKQCPVFPGIVQRLHWPFPDPHELTGTEEEKLAELRHIRDAIKNKISSWLTEN